MKIAFALLILINTSWAANETFQAALERLYPGCKLDKEILYLTKDQRKKTEEISGLKLHSGLANRYKTCKNTYVYVDSHIVRTMNQTVLVEVDKDKVKTFNVSAFMEPQEYRAPLKWLNQFAKKALNDLVLFKEIDGLSGATLTAKASVDAARRVLALDKALHEK